MKRNQFSINKRLNLLEQKVFKESRSSISGLSSSNAIDSEWFSPYGEIPETGYKGHMEWLEPSLDFREKVKRRFKSDIDTCKVSLFYDPDSIPETPYFVDVDMVLTKGDWITNQHVFSNFDSAVRFIKSKIINKSEFSGLGSWSDWGYIYY